MHINKLGTALLLSATFGLVACGDDSSSGTFDSGKEDSNIEKKSQINEEIEKLTEKISTMQSEYQKATKDFGSCDSENEDETKTATIADKKYKFTCDGYDWTCEEFDEDLDKVTADMQKLAYELATMDNETTGCNFKITDKTWSYGYTQNAGNETSKTSITVKINGDKYTTTTHMEVSGSSAAIACAYASELAEEGITCKGDVMITEDTDTGDIDGEEDLKDLFNNYMESCQYLNGNFDWEPEEEKDDEDVDKPSKDEDSDKPVVKPSKDEKDDSDSDEPVVKPSKDEKDDEGSDDDLDDIYQDIIDNPEKYGMSEEEAKEYQEAMKEIENASKAMDDMGECTADREGEKFTVTLYDQDMHYICKDEEWDIDYSAYGLDEDAFVED